jgi:hypothetical protein
MEYSNTSATSKIVLFDDLINNLQLQQSYQMEDFSQILVTLTNPYTPPLQLFLGANQRDLQRQRWKRQVWLTERITTLLL